MISIYETLDYRFWIKMALEDKRVENPNFSLRLLALKADIDPSLLSKVISNKRQLSAAAAMKIAEVFQLETDEKVYLKELLNIAKAKTDIAKQESYKKAMKLRKINSRKLSGDEHEFYSEWYHSALRNLLQIEPFYGKDHKEYGRKLRPAICAADVKRSIHLMRHLGLIEQNEEGRYELKELAVSSGEKYATLALRHFHKLNIQLAGESIERFQKEDRDISGLTINISKKDLEILREKIRKFRKEIVEYVSLNADPKQIYQLNFQLFPMSASAEDK